MQISFEQGVPDTTFGFGDFEAGVPETMFFGLFPLTAADVDIPSIIGPETIRSSKPQFIFQSLVPVRRYAKWKFHFKVQVYSDAGGVTLLNTVSSETTPDVFEYSSDNGVSWKPFPTSGLPREQYGSLVRVAIEAGPRTQVWIKLSVGADL